MARRYGNKVKTQRKWKKITKMNINEVSDFMKYLEKENQVFSKVYNHSLIHLTNLQENGKVLYK